MKKNTCLCIIVCIYLLTPYLINTTNAQTSYKSNEAVDFFKGIPDSSKVKIEKACAGISGKVPAKKQKLLVFNLDIRNKKLQRGHASVPYTNYAIQYLGKETGAYETYFSSDTMIFLSEYLNQFDAICFNNTVGILFENEIMRKNLLDFVYRGGGFIGIHGAGATFCQYPVYDQFPEFGEMLGGYENGGHPWGPKDIINLKIDDPEHPVNRAFKGENFIVSDEVFQFTKPYSNDRLRVLISIDTARTDMSAKRYILPERRADGDIAISWVKRYGKGRVFYTSFGHNPNLTWNPVVLLHYFDGMQFALGDLKASTVSTRKLTPAIKLQEKNGWRLGIEAYTFKNLTFLETIDKVSELGIPYVGGLNEQQIVSKEIPKRLDYNLTDDEIQQVRNKLVSAGVTMLTYYVFDIPGDEITCRKIFEFGRKLGIEVFISEPKIKDLDMIEKYCIEYNIKLALHNHGQRLSPVYMYPEKIVELCKGRSPLIGAACDFGHWAKEGIDPLQAVKILKQRVITIQMHDQNELTANGHDVPWGTGVVKLDQVYKFLFKEKIKPVMFGLEYSYNWGKSLPDVEQSIEFFNAQSISILK